VGRGPLWLSAPLFGVCGCQRGSVEAAAVGVGGEGEPAEAATASLRRSHATSSAKDRTEGRERCPFSSDSGTTLADPACRRSVRERFGPPGSRRSMSRGEVLVLLLAVQYIPIEIQVADLHVSRL
jgi:hypothetical protein